MLGYKNPRFLFQLSSGWSPTYHNYITSASIAKSTLTFLMVQFKFSVLFILAAAAIAPVLALPIPATNAAGPSKHAAGPSKHAAAAGPQKPQDNKYT